MSILTGGEILRQRGLGRIVISPFSADRLGPNSYDVTLAPELKVYSRMPLDMRSDNPTEDLAIPPGGLLLEPGRLYLASTAEEVGSDHYVTYLDGRSSVGRLGLQVHMTAGRGDLGWKGRWTLELAAIHPVRVYAGVRIGQATFHAAEGDASVKYVGKYLGDAGAAASRLHLDFLGPPPAGPQEEAGR